MAKRKDAKEKDVMGSAHSSSLRRRFLAAAEQLAGRRIYAAYRDLVENEGLSGEEIAALQWRKLEALLEHAYAAVPFYRRRFDEAGIRPDQIRTIDDFRRVPLTSKPELKAAYPDEMIASGWRRSCLVERQTTGTTDAPLSFVIDREMFDRGVARTRRVLDWAGSGRDTRVVLLGPIRERRTVAHRLYAWMERRLVLDTLALTSESTPLCCPSRDSSLPDHICFEKTAGYCEKIAEFQPDILYGYVTDLLALAAYVDATGRSDIRPRAVVSSAELLTEPGRRRLEEVFSAEVFDLYGATEFPAIACECEAHDGLHILSDTYLVELLTEGRATSPGEVGEVIITDLENRVMPFVRYRIGDAARAAKRSCRCGRPFPLIEVVEGRTSEVAVTPGGGLLLARRFAAIIGEMGRVRRFRIVQERIDRLEVQIVVEEPWTTQHEASLRERVSAYAGGEVQVSVTRVPHLAPDPSRKERFLYSSLDIDIARGPCCPP
jgi:phenylacetate-CoA ligase